MRALDFSYVRDDTTDVRRKTREECFSFLPERTSLERRGGMFNLRRIKRNNGRIVERDIIFTYLDSRSFAISSNNSFPTDLTSHRVHAARTFIAKTNEGSGRDDTDRHKSENLKYLVVVLH